MSALAADASAGISEIIVTARRLAPAASEQVLATTVIDRAELMQAGGGRLDDALRNVPGFTLFRRQSSRASHPTTQGVTLRGLGPSGAGRTLVLLDGVPQNDPFGGWIDWSRLPPATLDSVSLTRGGGAGPWGNAALAGTIRLASSIPTGLGATADGSVDSFGTVSGTGSVYAPLGKGRLLATVAGHDGPGPYLIRADQRGPIDIRTEDRGGLAQAMIVMPLDDETEITVRGGYSLDNYVNGIAIAKSRVRNTDGSVGLVHQGAADQIGWEMHAYLRDGNQPAMFSSVNATRTTATPSLEQFAVPETAVGGNGILRVPVTPEFAVDVGVDVRQARGSTQEKFTFVAPAFTRVRDAGGEQVVAGGFAEANWTPRADVTITGAARVDHWRQDEGHRREVVIADGSVARDDRYAVRQGTVSNFRLGGRVDVSSAWSLRATGYTGFRIPTLNELYRPFRVGNDITEANPTLRPERLYGIEAGARWAVTTEIALDVTVFAARLRDAVGNVTVRSAPGLDPVLNVVVPAGGVLRQRRNIDRVHSEGIETELTWRARDNISLTARYLYTAPTISRSASQPALEGLDLAQVARHQATFSVSWQPWNGATWRAEGLLASGQFDDDQNTRRLSGYATVDLYLEQAVSERVAVYARGDNLFDRTIEAGRSADGLVTVGTPRAATVGFRVKL